MLIYAAAAVLFLLLVLGLIRRTRHQEMSECPPEPFSFGATDGRWLGLSERIFDPSDARWLAEELAFPQLAATLTRARKQMAVRWLETLQSSFDEVVRTPGLNTDEFPESDPYMGWRMLWLTLRFKVLVSYALFIVKTLGPYHRLIPAGTWSPLVGANKLIMRPAALANSRISR
jgi:hypothetical protein